MAMPMRTGFDMATDDDLRRYCDTLPQCGHIQEGAFLDWARRIESQGDKPLAWHIKRLMGWGGSEIGALVAEDLGIFDPFTCAHDLVAGKLLQVPPPQTTAAMRRGTLLEPAIAQIFYADYGATPLPEVKAAIEAVSDPAHLWKSANLDDVVEIDGKRFLVDYKAPGDIPNGVAFGYHCQLNHYDALATLTGEAVDGLVLACFDYKKGMVVAFEVEQDANIKTLIDDTGDRYWKMVLDGEIPPYPDHAEREPMSLTEAGKESLRALEKTFLRETLLAGIHTDNAKSIRAEMDAMLKSTGQRLKTAENPFSMLRMQVSERLKGDQIHELLTRQNIDPESIKTATPGSYDAEAMAAHLRSIGHDPAQFLKKTFDADTVNNLIDSLGLERGQYINESIALKMPTAKSKAGQTVAQMKEDAKTLASRASDSVSQASRNRKRKNSPSPALG